MMIFNAIVILIMIAAGLMALFTICYVNEGKGVGAFIDKISFGFFNNVSNESSKSDI